MRDTTPASPPASRALHITTDDGGKGGGARSDPAAQCGPSRGLHMYILYIYKYDTQCNYTAIYIVPAEWYDTRHKAPAEPLICPHIIWYIRISYNTPSGAMVHIFAPYHRIRGVIIDL